jgi:hypothetical protein
VIRVCRERLTPAGFVPARRALDRPIHRTAGVAPHAPKQAAGRGERGPRKQAGGQRGGETARPQKQAAGRFRHGSESRPWAKFRVTNSFSV